MQAATEAQKRVTRMESFREPQNEIIHSTQMIVERLKGIRNKLSPVPSPPKEENKGDPVSGVLAEHERFHAAEKQLLVECHSILDDLENHI